MADNKDLKFGIKLDVDIAKFKRTGKKRETDTGDYQLVNSY